MDRQRIEGGLKKTTGTIKEKPAKCLVIGVSKTRARPRKPRATFEAALAKPWMPCGTL